MSEKRITALLAFEKLIGNKLASPKPSKPDYQPHVY
jgi:hypothetical protein